MDKKERQQIMDGFIRIVDHLSDKEYQIRAWIKGEEADFDEAVCLFFGEVDPILANYKDFEITEDQYKLIKKFRDHFKKFSDKNDYPPLFIYTPEWKKVMDQANEVLIAFNYQERDQGNCGKNGTIC